AMTALEHYQQALHHWLQSQPPQALQGLALLQARDRLQHTLDQTPLADPQSLLILQDLDKTLEAQAQALDEVISFEQCRKTLLPPIDRWWWFLDQTKPPHPLDRFDWLFNTIGLGAWTVSLALLVDLSRRVFIGGSGVAGLSVLTLSSLVTLLKARSDLTEAGQQGFRTLLEKLGVKSYWQAEATCLTTTLLATALTALWLGLPDFSRSYNRLGRQAQHNGELGQAERLYTQAIALDEDNLDAHYNLGTLYEDLQDVDRATTQYLIAIQGDLPDAYNNLAHLYLQTAIQSQDPSVQTQKQQQAIALLSQGLPLAEQTSPPSVLYSFYKNLGWARLLQGNPQVAEPLLQTAIEISQDSEPNTILNEGSAHCLLALSLDAQQSPQALQSWQSCCQLSTNANPNEDAWILEAHKKLNAHSYDPNTVCRPSAPPVS
ncbi:MAG: tetratricopeptide repeat protein, partial [Prochlorothrix sp.]|nr:tetratricopeptide repeat protein [Prochlorothrix sp.]